MNPRNKKILNFLALMFIVGFVTFLVPQSLGLGSGGFDEILVQQQFSFYLAGGIFALFLIVAFVISLIVKKDDEKFGSSIGFASLGENPALPIFKRFSIFQFSYLCILFFGIVGLFSFVAKMQTFTGIGSVEQQFTPVGQLLFSAGLIPGSENFGLALVIAAAYLLLRFTARRINMSSASYKMYAYLFIPLLGGFYWLFNHLLRYPTQDLAKTVVFFFGYIQALLTVLTGCFAIGWIMHMSNNLAYDLQKHFASDNVVVMVVSILILLTMGYVYLFKGRLMGKGRIE